MGWTVREGEKRNSREPGSCTEFIVAWGFPGGSDGKESACSVGDLALVPGLWSLEKGMAPHSRISNWRISWTEKPHRLHGVHGVTKSWTRLSNTHIVTK